MSLLSRHISIPLFDRLAGDTRLSFLGELENEFSRRSPDELDSLQVERFWNFRFSRDGVGGSQQTAREDTENSDWSFHKPLLEYLWKRSQKKSRRV